MDSSDFLRQILFQPYLAKTLNVHRTFPGTRMFLLTISPPWLLNMFPYNYWTSTCIATLPTYSAFMIPVRQACNLPSDSQLSKIPLPLSISFRCRVDEGLRLLKHAPAGRTIKIPSETSSFGRFFDSIHNLCKLQKLLQKPTWIKAAGRASCSPS